MSDYSRVHDFSVKDALATGNPSKQIVGSEVDDELDAIVTAILSKYDNTDAPLDTLVTLGDPAADGEFLVATGAGALAWETGATARTSIGLGTGDDVTFTGLTATGEVTYSGVISPTQITASVNDYAPTGIAAAATIRVDADAAGWNITGLSASQAEGREITIENDGTVAFNLTDEDALSTAANRFALPNSLDVAVEPESSVTLKYDGTATRWRIKGAAGSGGGAKDAGGNTIGFNHDQATAGNYTLVATENMVTAGTFTITSGDTVTIASGARWVIV